MGAKGQRPDQVRSDAEINQLIADALPIVISDVTDLQTELNAKAETPIAISDVTDLQTELNAKLESPIAISDVTDLQTELNAKLESPIAISDVTDLQTTLDGIGGLTYAKVIKLVDETLADSTTLQNDDELFVALQANKIYNYILILYATAHATPAIKLAFTVPSGASGFSSHLGFASGVFGTTTNFPNEEATNTGNALKKANLCGRIVVGGTPGNLTFQWAQNTSSATVITVHKGSMLLVWEE